MSHVTVSGAWGEKGKVSHVTVSGVCFALQLQLQFLLQLPSDLLQGNYNFYCNYIVIASNAKGNAEAMLKALLGIARQC